MSIVHVQVNVSGRQQKLQQVEDLPFVWSESQDGSSCASTTEHDLNLNDLHYFRDTTSAPAAPTAITTADPATFSQLCNSGAARRWSNLHARAFRRVAHPILKPLLKLAMKRDMPTNVSMLMMRSANAAFGYPNTNKDAIALKFYQALRPEEATGFAPTGGASSFYAHFRRALFEMPGVGIPGMINFLDARTQWIDDCLVRAIDSGIKQVRFGRGEMCTLFCNGAERGWFC